MTVRPSATHSTPVAARWNSEEPKPFSTMSMVTATYWLTVFHFASREAGTITPTPAAPDNHPPDPARIFVDGEQRDEGARDQQLVGDGVEERSERGHLVAAASHHAIQPVRERGEGEDAGADERVHARRRD